MRALQRLASRRARLVAVLFTDLHLLLGVVGFSTWYPAQGSLPGQGMAPVETQAAVAPSVGGTSRREGTPAAAAATVGAPIAAAVAPSIVPASVPATGSRSARLEVPAFGRYAIQVASGQGTALQIVDRMSGPGPLQGSTGETDGRVDLFLDRGEYKVVTYAPENGKGEARLAVHPFEEKNRPEVPVLVELKPVEGSLGDYEQISFWMQVKERRWVFIEAAGRNLADLRLWRDGSWLYDAEPRQASAEPRAGAPLAVRSLAVDLGPGLYLLTAYGGPPLPWAEETGEHPFHLRLGVPRLGDAGRRRYTMSPFGSDRWIVPGNTNYFRLEIPEARPASIMVAAFSPSDPGASGSRTEITKKSSPPVAEIQEGGTEGTDRILTIAGEAGQPYVLQHFEKRWEYTFRKSGDYWISTIHTGDPADSVDATALVTRSAPENRREPDPESLKRPYLSQLVEIDSSHGWARRCNLLGTLTVFLHVKEARKYEVLSRGAEARFRVEPFMTWRPSNYEAPLSRGSGSVWDLDEGYWVLTVDPEQKGIVDLAIRPSGLLDRLWDMIGMGADKSNAVRGAVRFPSVPLENDRWYTMWINQQPEVNAGIVLRQLPLDLAAPLPLVMAPGDEVSISFEAKEPGILRAEAEDGTALELSLDGGPWERSSSAVKPGRHVAAVRWTGSKTVPASVLLDPERLGAATPLTALPDAQRSAIVEFPVLEKEEPRLFDLDRAARATYLVRATAPALYRLESTGLLATEGNLRTRTVTSFDRQAMNGVGRNFIIQQYLREGDYQVTVTAQGQSKGRVGLSLARTPLVSGGVLGDGVPARATLAPGQAIVYDFAIAEKDDYTIHAVSRGRGLRCRLEDADGWPIEKPGIEASITRKFEPGAYRLVLLPEAIGAKTVSLIQRVAKPLRFEGHGPHSLPLATKVEHLWLEPVPGERKGRATAEAAGKHEAAEHQAAETDAERPPDIWEFTVPARMKARIDLTGEMQGTVVAVRGDGEGVSKEVVATLPPGRGWTGTLGAGRYRLEAICVRRNNRSSYEIGVWPEPLVEGTRKAITVPSEIPVSVGRDCLFDLFSTGSEDVRARLLDRDGNTIASNDDRPDDWNFDIARRLGPGEYRLLVDPVGASNAATTVGMSAIEEKEGGTLHLPADKTIEPAGSVRLVTLVPSTKADLLVISASSAESIGCSVECRVEGGFRGPVGTSVGRLARLEIPRGEGKGRCLDYRLRIWSSDRRESPIHLQAAAIETPRASESKLSQGIVLPKVPGIDPPVGAVAVTIRETGLFRLPSAASGLRVSATPDEPCAEPAGGLYPVVSGSGDGGATLWIVADPGSREGPVRAARAQLAPGPAARSALRLDASHRASFDLQPNRNGPTLVIASSISGQPGVGLMGPGQTKGTRLRASRGMAIGEGSALTVSLEPGVTRGVLWNADEPPHGILDGPNRTAEPIDIRLRQTHFTQPVPGKLAMGTTSGTIAGQEAKAFALPPGEKRIRLSLGEGTAAALSGGSEILSTHWGGGQAIDETLVSSADRLTLMNARRAAGAYTIEILEKGGASEPQQIAQGTPFEGSFSSSGTLRLTVMPLEPADPNQLREQRLPNGERDDRPRLHVRGSRGMPALIGADSGSVQRGSETLVESGGGTLLVPHGPGSVLAWIERPGEKAAALWGASSSGTPVRVIPPALVPLSGKVEVLRIEGAGPAMVHVRAAIPAISMVTVEASGDRAADFSSLAAREAGDPGHAGLAPEVPDEHAGGVTSRVDLHDRAVSLDVYAPGGTATIALRAQAGNVLSGEAEVTMSPVTPIHEGLGPRVLLPAGETRIYSFEVASKGKVGIGVRGSADVLESTLLDAVGNKIGSGVVQMPELEPGTYLLALHVPESATVVEARPALVGIEPPGTGPPIEVIRAYVEGRPLPAGSGAIDSAVGSAEGSGARGPDDTRGAADTPGRAGRRGSSGTRGARGSDASGQPGAEGRPERSPQGAEGAEEPESGDDEEGDGE